MVVLTDTTRQLWYTSHHWKVVTRKQRPHCSWKPTKSNRTRSAAYGFPSLASSEAQNITVENLSNGRLRVTGEPGSAGNVDHKVSCYPLGLTIIHWTSWTTTNHHQPLPIIIHHILAYLSHDQPILTSLSTTIIHHHEPMIHINHYSTSLSTLTNHPPPSTKQLYTAQDTSQRSGGTPSQPARHQGMTGRCGYHKPWLIWMS